MEQIEFKIKKDRIVTKCIYQPYAFVGGTNCYSHCRYFNGFTNGKKNCVNCSFLEDKKELKNDD